mmetsp:Transcript_64432/g.172548  ORF Transcript_64432/g.172548 Transcript_64432/m.172548 type:complete len:418 (-) Transcript_64432:908-2161(-)
MSDHDARETRARKARGGKSADDGLVGGSGGVDEYLHDGGVGEGGHIAHLLGVARRDVAQDATHDLAAARLGQALREADHLRRGEGADAAPHLLAQRRRNLLRGGVAVLEHHEAVHRLPLDLVRHAHHGGLGHALVHPQRALHLGGADAVAGQVDHVVDPAREPEVALAVTPAPVPGHVVAVRKQPVVLVVEPEVGLLEPRVVAVQRPHHARPRLLDGEVAAALHLLHLAPLPVEDDGDDAEEGARGGAGLGGRRAGQRRDHVPARLRLPPGVDDRAAVAAHDLVVPLPGLLVDRLAHGAQQPQARQVVRLHEGVAELHEGADGGGGGVELAHAVPLHDLPEPGGGRVRGDALEEHLGGAGEHGPVGEVGVARDPAAVGRAEVHVPLLVVERVPEGGAGPDHVAARCVQHPLGLPGRP